MDDHLFVNLRTPCSRFVTAGGMKISSFLHFSPSTSGSRSLRYQAVAHYVLTVIRATEDGDVLGVRRLLEQRWARTCDVISGTFLCLWQMTVFSPLSWPQHLLLQIHPPPRLCLGRMSWQLSHSRCFTDEKLHHPHPHPHHHPPPPPSSSSFSLFLAKSIAL